MSTCNTLVRLFMRSLVRSWIVLIALPFHQPWSDVLGHRIIGTDICYCVPLTYTFQFNFSSQCPQSTINNTIPGINDTSCLVESRGPSNNVADSFPVVINEVQIYEIDQNFAIVGQTVTLSSIRDGGTISYTSVVAQTPETVTEKTLPLALGFTAQALNSLEEAITLTWTIQYTNECGIFTQFTKGQAIGWIVFADLGDASEEFCPLPGGPPSQILSYPPYAQSTFQIPTTEPCTPSKEPTLTPDVTISAFVDATDAPVFSKKKNRKDSKKSMDDWKGRRLNHYRKQEISVGLRPTPSPMSICPDVNDDVTPNSSPNHEKLEHGKRSMMQN